MRIALSLVGIILALATTSTADDGLIIAGNNSQQTWVPDAEKVYASTCSVVEREFRTPRPVKPPVTLVVGGSENRAFFRPRREIRLTKWDPHLFAQGVVIFALEDLLSETERIAVAARAVKLAESTVDVKDLEQVAARPQ